MECPGHIPVLKFWSKTLYEGKSYKNVQVQVESCLLEICCKYYNLFFKQYTSTWDAFLPKYILLVFLPPYFYLQGLQRLELAHVLELGYEPQHDILQSVLIGTIYK